MRRTAIRKVYGDLAPQELCRLAVWAQARGDDAEREALLSSCPRVAVRTIHPGFEAALEGMWALLDVAVPSLARYLGWLEALEAIHEPVQEAVAFLLGTAKPAPSDPPPFVGQHVARAHALQLLGAVMAALAEVCAERSLDSTGVLRAFAPGLGQALERRAESIREAGPAPDAQEGFRSLLLQAWADSQR